MLEIHELVWWQWLVFLVPTVLLLVVMPLWFFWLGRFPKIPKGTRVDESFGPMRVHVVWHPGGLLGGAPNRALVAKACMAAVRVTKQTWKAMEKDDGHILDRILIYFQPGYEFEQSKLTDIRTAAAYATWSGAHVGSGIPMAVIRTEYVTKIVRMGEPVIHEMLHVLLDEFSEIGGDREHSHPRAWLATAKHKSVQSAARGRYLEETDVLRAEAEQKEMWMP